MRIETERLIITEFTMDMAESVHINSLDEDNRRFVSDEVFETVEDAAETIESVIMPRLGITEMLGICLAENIGSVKVMERSGFAKEFEGMGSYQGEDREICKFVFRL